jgi:hypothetical protein
MNTFKPGDKVVRDPITTSWTDYCRDRNLDPHRVFTVKKMYNVVALVFEEIDHSHMLSNASYFKLHLQKQYKLEDFL